jgi:hypothetical protein
VPYNEHSIVRALSMFVNQSEFRAESDIYGTVEQRRTRRSKQREGIKHGPKPLRANNMAEREGFEPSVQVLARTTV